MRFSRASFSKRLAMRSDCGQRRSGSRAGDKSAREGAAPSCPSAHRRSVSSMSLRVLICGSATTGACGRARSTAWYPLRPPGHGSALRMMPLSTSSARAYLQPVRSGSEWADGPRARGLWMPPEACAPPLVSSASRDEGGNPRSCTAEKLSFLMRELRRAPPSPHAGYHNAHDLVGSAPFGRQVARGRRRSTPLRRRARSGGAVSSARCPPPTSTGGEGSGGSSRIFARG